MCPCQLDSSHPHSRLSSATPSQQPPPTPQRPPRLLPLQDLSTTLPATTTAVILILIYHHLCHQLQLLQQTTTHGLRTLPMATIRHLPPPLRLSLPITPVFCLQDQFRPTPCPTSRTLITRSAIWKARQSMRAVGQVLTETRLVVGHLLLLCPLPLCPVRPAVPINSSLGCLLLPCRLFLMLRDTAQQPCFRQPARR